MEEKKIVREKYEDVNGKCWARKSKMAFTGLPTLVSAIIAQEKYLA